MECEKPTESGTKNGSLLPYALAASPVGQGKQVTNTNVQCCRVEDKGERVPFS